MTGPTGKWIIIYAYMIEILSVVAVQYFMHFVCMFC